MPNLEAYTLRLESAVSGKYQISSWTGETHGTSHRITSVSVSHWELTNLAERKY